MFVYAGEALGRECTGVPQSGPSSIHHHQPTHRLLALAESSCHVFTDCIYVHAHLVATNVLFIYSGYTMGVADCEVGQCNDLDWGV